MSNMRQVVVTSSEDIEVMEVPRPGPPAPGQVLVASRLVGICGTDVHAAAGHHPFIDRPYRPGHEVVGVVEQVGEGVTDLAAGDRVVLEPNLTCGECPQCRDGRYNICRNLAVFGCQTPGGMGDVFVVARDRLHRIPDGMSDELAALVEPLATPVHAVRRAGLRAGSRVAVLGAGPIGLLVLVAARAAGAEVVVVTDVLPEKLDRARRLGAAEALRADAPDLVDRAAAVLQGADVVFDCVASAGSMAQAVELVDKGGTVMVVGIAAGPTSIPLHLVQDREISVIGSLMYVREDVEQAIALLSSGAVAADELVTAVYPLDRAAEAFAASADPQQVKVLVSVGDTA
ncbi:2-desacetyl-2-hydroxyethyl bacteriochlorophyllide A dehydrogenase [Pseudonocardia hierapolitana]|uniref:2-desacetyl-2-hydroxyethyl bacteriochlorophyllide A dehydrogenase n=1 Tax=Pseudonocardia hierapolitana TaxID=1128676 RepID=A0A561SKC1_9PSEU|nr:alcohol dehydrogenase catalytic domain-containing protein [Pseudonocardia hierapolitana]TWF75283.1 2-desacetyl-2-hydroxyethyl bacteriochlorophyllide A dehydrogenase [Pseudonocardia hierapolitana]